MSWTYKYHIIIERFDGVETYFMSDNLIFLISIAESGLQEGMYNSATIGMNENP